MYVLHVEIAFKQSFSPQILKVGHHSKPSFDTINIDELLCYNKIWKQNSSYEQWKTLNNQMCLQFTYPVVYYSLVYYYFRK